MPRYRLVRVHPEAENHLQAAQKLLAGGNYGAAAAEYGWVALSYPSHPSAQEAQLWARTLRQLLSLQEELSRTTEEWSRTTEKLNSSKREMDGLRRKGSSLEGKAQKLEEEKQKLKVEVQEVQQEIQKLKESYIQLEKLERDLKRGKSETGVPGR